MTENRGKKKWSFLKQQISDADNNLKNPWSEDFSDRLSFFFYNTKPAQGFGTVCVHTEYLTPTYLFLRSVFGNVKNKCNMPCLSD